MTNQYQREPDESAQDWYSRLQEARVELAEQYNAAKAAANDEDSDAPADDPG